MITLDDIINVAVILMAIWGFYKVVMEVVHAITNRHDKEQKWSEWEENLQKERDKIYDKYDAKLSEIENKINTNHADTEAKIQQTQTELFILTECMAAVLDGFKQLNCNGKVTEAKNNLDAYLMKRAHE
jgi:SPX domain protein involved in polyphosphate accumulation